MNTPMQPMPVTPPPRQGLLGAWLHALAPVVRDKGVLLLVVVVWVVITCARWLPEQMLPWNFKRRAMRLVNINNLILYIFM